MLQIAHRGASGYCRDNSILSIKKAIELGVDIIEIDIQVTKEGILILNHDTTIKLPNQDKNCWVSELSLEELLKIEPEIIQLHTALDLILKTNIKVYLDLKQNFMVKDLYFKVLLKELKKYCEYGSQIILCSFNHKLINNLKRELPDFDFGVIILGQCLEPYLNLLKEEGIHIIVTNVEDLDEEFYISIKKFSLQIWVYTINDPNILQEFHSKNIHIDGFITDFPKDLNISKF